MRRRRKGDRLGKLLFLIPSVLIAAVVVYAAVLGTASTDGTLVVSAQSSSRYYPAQDLNAAASVGGHQGTTPFNVTLSQGPYTVTFQPLRWYTTPAGKALNVSAGRTSFAVGIYRPILDVVSASPKMFNVSNIEAMHNVTPVVLENPTDAYVTVYSVPTGTVAIPPMQNFTYVFRQSGTFAFSLPLSSSPSLVVTVA